MLTKLSLTQFLRELASNSPAPGGGSVAALAGALGSSLTSMVCNLTLGKKKYAEFEHEISSVLKQSEELRDTFADLVDQDTMAFNKVMEAFGLPKDTDEQKALRGAAIEAATKEAALVPLEVMKHVIDGLALARIVAQKGNTSSVSDAGVSAIILHAGLESAALNVQINLKGIKDSDFVGWKADEVASLLRTSKNMTEEVLAIVRKHIGV